MVLSPLTELRLFGICFLCGLLLGFLFDLFRIPRRLFPAGYGRTLVQDLLYFALAGGLTVYTIFTANGGLLRGFELVALGLGFGSYQFILSRLFLPLLIRLSVFFIRLIKFFLFFITFPLRILTKPAIIICVSLRHFLRRNGKKVKTHLTRAMLFMKKT